MIQLRPSMLLPLVAVAALSAACSKTPEPSSTSTSTSTKAPERPATPPAAAAPKADGEVAWDVPSGWESAPNPNAMRKATYKIKRAAGDPEDAELSVSQAGGSVDANIQRWIGQFAKQSEGSPKRSEVTVNNIKVSVVEVRGTFSGSGMPGMPAGEPKASAALLGAIAELPGGGMWFFKMTGPEKTVTGARGDFDKLVNSLRVK